MVDTTAAPWLGGALRDMDDGVKRIKGAEAHPRIIEYYDAVGLDHDGDDEQSYCGAGLGCWLKECGFPIPPGAYGAKSFETYGRALAAPVPGAILVFYRTALRERDWRRHVTIFIRDLGNGWYECLGANQAAGAVCVSRYPRVDLVPGAIRWPVAATVADLRAAGSTEIKAADDLTKLALGTGGTSLLGAAVNQAATAPAPVIPPIPQLDAMTLKQAAEQAGYGQKLLEACAAAGKLIGAHPWLAAAVLLSVGLIVFAVKWKRRRVAKAAAGVPLSNALAG